MRLALSYAAPCDDRADMLQVAGFAASDKSSFQTNGLRVGGVKYMVT